MSKQSGFLNHDNARTNEQVALMRKIEEDGVCPFCKENFTKYHPKPILKETDYWFVTTNMSPYKGTVHHFLFVYKPEHLVDPRGMSAEASIDFFDCVNWVITEYNIEGASLFMRFGDTRFTKSSVEHLHAQLLVGVRDDKSTEKIKPTLGWQKSG